MTQYKEARQREWFFLNQHLRFIIITSLLVKWLLSYICLYHVSGVVALFFITDLFQDEKKNRKPFKIRHDLRIRDAGW